MTTIYYLSTIIFLLIELHWLVSPIEKTKEARKFLKLSKLNKGKKWDELPEDYQRVISGFMFPYYIVNEDYEIKFTDEDKINWFKYINFAGTPQDTEHLTSLS